MSKISEKQSLAGKKAAATKRIKNDGAVVALSVRQPLAELILQGKKTIEYRRMPTHKRGRVYLYAGQVIRDFQDEWEDAGANPGDLPTGALVGTVEIVGCTGRNDSYQWNLARPARLERPKPPDRQPQPVFFRPFETHGVDESITERQPFTIFSWGFHGWGNSTDQLIRSVDSIERSRGFKPPLFVEIRIQRSGRAVGFNGTSFEALLGRRRYAWLSDLGNKAILEGRQGIEIKNPSAAGELLDLAVKAIDDGRRVIYFCGCKHQKKDGRIRCHRWAVGKYLLAVAAKAGISVSLEEWPGGEPEHIELTVTPQVVRNAIRGGPFIPLGELNRIPRFAALPHGSIATIKSSSAVGHVITGPAVLRAGKWFLPMLKWIDAEHHDLLYVENRTRRIRQHMGWERRQ